MKAGFWINYRTGGVFPIQDHEQWIRVPQNAAKAGVPNEIVSRFGRFTPLQDRDEFLLYLINNVPLMRVRGHGATVTFEYADTSRREPLDAVLAWSNENLGPASWLNITNLATGERISMRFEDFAQAMQKGGPESVLRRAMVSPRLLMAELDTEWHVRLAGSRENYLQSIGASPEIIQYIVSQDPERSKWLTNQFRKNPHLSLQELTALQPEEPDATTFAENALANSYVDIPGMSEWVLVQLRKYRLKKIPISDRPSYGNFPPYEFQYKFPDPIAAAYGLSPEHSLRFAMLTLFDPIRDWARATHPQFASYDLLQAWQASKEWHKETAAKGAGGGYEERNVVFDFGTVDEKYDGWTLQEVKTENDLEVEGNKMGHCVGSYCEYVSSGDTVILSLRDPQNNPHVTIEANPKKDTARAEEAGLHQLSVPTEETPWMIQQIQGKGNSAPIAEYKKLVREWVKRTPYLEPAAEDAEPLSRALFNIDRNELSDFILDWDEGEANEYGLRHRGDVRPEDVEDVVDSLFGYARDSNRRQQYAQWMGQAGRAFVQLLWSLDRKQPRTTIPTRLEALESVLQKREEKQWDDFHQYQDYGYDAPKRTQFETEDEYDQALETYQQDQEEVWLDDARQYVDGGILHAMWDELNELRKQETTKTDVPRAAKTAGSAGAPTEFLYSWVRDQFPEDTRVGDFEFRAIERENLPGIGMRAEAKVPARGGTLSFVVFMMPLAFRATVEKENAERYLKATQWFTDVEILWYEQPSGRPALLYHRERSWKTQDDASRDFHELLDKFSNMTIDQFLDMAGPTMGKLSRRKYARGVEDVPIEILRAWKRAHKAGDAFSESRDKPSLQYYVESLKNFIAETVRLQYATETEQKGYVSYINSVVAQLPKIPFGERYPARHSVEAHYKLDSIVNQVHETVLEGTLTERKHWYDWGVDHPMSSKDSPKIDYQPDPWLKELWERKVKRERGIHAASSEHKGFFVALFLDETTAKKIAQDGGEPVDDLHVTLCYCEDVDAIGEEKIDKAFDVIRGVATEHAPLDGKIGGWGRFTGGETSNGKEVVYAVPDVPGLTALREELAERLTTIGVAPRDEHGFTPHITLKYVAENEEFEPTLPDDVSLKFTQIRVRAGDRTENIDLAGPESAREAMNRLRTSSFFSVEDRLAYIKQSDQAAQQIDTFGWDVVPYTESFNRTTRPPGSKRATLDIPLTEVGETMGGSVEFRCFLFPLNTRDFGSQKDVERFKKSSHWFTDVEVFYHGDLIFHRERAWKTQEEADARFTEMLQHFGSMTLAQFIDMAKPFGGKLSKQADSGWTPGSRPSSLPKSTIKPHTPFPGDTVRNKGEQDFWQPWDDAVQWDAEGKYGEPVDYRAPGTIGVPLPTVNPSVTDDNDKRKKLPRMFQSQKNAYSIAPLTQRRNVPEDSELLVRLPDDIYERYRDLASRVKTYAQNVDLTSMDVYDYPPTPPQRWVEREMRRHPVDWTDANVAGGVLIQAAPSDVSMWFNFSQLDEAQLQALAPDLYAHYALDNDGTQDFATWYVEHAPFAARDKTFVQNFLQSVQDNPKSTFGQKYDTAWRRKNNDAITEVAFNGARDHWLDSIRGKVEFARADAKPHLETLHQLRNDGRVPIHDTLSALSALPIADASLSQLHSERDTLVNEGMHALDLYREPVSRDDRLSGDLEVVGERVVPVRQIFGTYDTSVPMVNAVALPLSLYQYGSAYFLVHESDAGRLQAIRQSGVLSVFANVTKVIPGSSIRKRVALTVNDWNQKAKILRTAIDELTAGADKTSVFMKYGRQYGPGFRTAINDFLYVKSQHTGKVVCANWENQQTADNCGNCTFWPNKGNDVEFGTGGCYLSDFFMNSPDSGFGRKEAPSAYDSESNPPKQKNPRSAQEKPHEQKQTDIQDEEFIPEEDRIIEEPQESPGAVDRGTDVYAPPAGTTIPTEPVPLDQLNDPQSSETLTQIYGRVGTITPGMDTTERLKVYDLTPFVENPEITNQMLSDLGFRVEYFSFEENQERGVSFRTPDLKRKGYNNGYVWIYDPRNDHGSFKDAEYTRAWRTFHEVGHGVTEQFMHGRYGPSKREGRLGAQGVTYRGKPPKQQAVQTRPLTLAEAQRAVEWEDVAFRAQRILQAEYGVSVSDEEFAQEMNINIIDAMYRVMTGDFGNPGEYGFMPSTTAPNVRDLLQWLANQEQALAVQQGRQPTAGIDLASWQPVSDDEIRVAIQHRKQQRRGFSLWRRYGVEQSDDLPGYKEVERLHLDYSPEELNAFSAAVVKRHNETGGSTFNFHRGDLSGKKYYALSLYPERTEILAGEVFPDDVRAFIDSNADLFSDARHSVGTWVNPDGNTELDVIVTIPSQYDALSLAKQYNQKAIMNLENYDVVLMEGTGEEKPDQPRERYLEDIGAARRLFAYFDLDETRDFMVQVNWDETFEQNYAEMIPPAVDAGVPDAQPEPPGDLFQPSTDDSKRFVSGDGLIDEAIGATNVSGAAKKTKKSKPQPGLPPYMHPGLALRPPEEGGQTSLFESEADPDVLRSRRGINLPAPHVYNSSQYQNVIEKAPVVPFDPQRPESIDEAIAFLENTTGLQVRHRSQKMRPIEFFLFPTEFGDARINHIIYAAWFALYSANTAVESEEKQFVTWLAGKSGSDPNKLGILSRKNKLIELLKFLKWAGYPKFERLDAVLDDFNPADEAYQERLLALSRLPGIQPKVASFMLALLGDRRSPTLDMHAIGYLIGKGKIEVPEGQTWTPLRELYDMQKKLSDVGSQYGAEHPKYQELEAQYNELAQGNKKLIAAINAQTRILRSPEKASSPGASPKVLETEKRKIKTYMARQMEGWDGDTNTFWIWYSSNNYFETHEPRRDMIHSVFFQSLFPELFTPEALQQREQLREQFQDDPEGLKERLKYRDYLENLEEMRKIRKVKPLPKTDRPEMDFNWESGEFELEKAAQQKKHYATRNP